MTKQITDTSYGIIPLWRSPDGLRLLVVQHLAGHWGFPKGHPEPGETPEQTAAREAAEEVGLTAVRLRDVPPLQQHYSYTHEGTQVHKTVVLYLGEVADPVVRLQPEEIQASRWATLAEARALVPANTRPLLDELAPYLA